MQTLPTLITPEFRSDLPLSEPAAECLIRAFSTRDSAARLQYFVQALTADPALAIWTLLRANHSGSLTTIDALAGWLLESGVTLFERGTPTEIAAASPTRSPGLPDNLVAAYADGAGCSLVMAQLASHLAPAAGADPQQAYLLGLVHLASSWLQDPDWLVAYASDEPPPSGRISGLPAWLQSCLFETVQGPKSAETSCLLQAMGLAFSTDEAAWRAVGLEPAEWIGRMERLSKTWAQPGNWSDTFFELATQLARLERLEAQFSTELEAAKLESLKELAYGAGHEINNPLANISGRAQTLLHGESDPERRRMLASIHTQAFRAHEMIADMMLFARPPLPQLAMVNLNELVAKFHSELAQRAAEQQTVFELLLPPESILVSADATQIAVAIRVLCVNALEALIERGNVTLELLSSEVSPGHAAIRVTDDGPGISPRVRAHLFDPFFSGREAGRGIGCGLSKCWRIVTDHGGRIEVSTTFREVDAPLSEPPATTGSSFTLLLPHPNSR